MRRPCVPGNFGWLAGTVAGMGGGPWALYTGDALVSGIVGSETGAGWVVLGFFMQRMPWLGRLS